MHNFICTMKIGAPIYIPIVYIKLLKLYRKIMSHGISVKILRATVLRQIILKCLSNFLETTREVGRAENTLDLISVPKSAVNVLLCKIHCCTFFFYQDARLPVSHHSTRWQHYTICSSRTKPLSFHFLNKGTGRNSMHHGYIFTGL